MIQQKKSIMDLTEASKLQDNKIGGIQGSGPGTPNVLNQKKSLGTINELNSIYEQDSHAKPSFVQSKIQSSTDKAPMVLKSSIAEVNKGDRSGDDQFLNVNLLNSEEDIERLDASQHSGRSRSMINRKSDLD